jgi:hydrogenase/urease accessory protein HupE
MRSLARNVLAVSASLAPLSAFAHPGPHRDEMAWGLVHAISNPDHSLMAIGAGTALVAWIAAALVAVKSDRTAAGRVDAR